MRIWKVIDGHIEVEGDQLRYLPYYHIHGCLFKGQRLIIPLTKQNVDYILKEVPPGKSDIYTPSFAEGCLKMLDQDKIAKGKLNYVKKISMDNINIFPLLVNHKGLKPFKNQKIGLQWTNKFDEHGLFWEMGTGKTRTGIETYINKRGKGLITKCLVVCPVSMLQKWIEEVEKWSEYSGVALAGTKEQKREYLEEDWDFYSINYESVLALKDELLERIDGSWLIIADEFTKIKNPGAQRTKALLEVAMKTKHKLMLSGTPVTQGPHDLFAPFLFLDNGKTFGYNYDNFIQEYFWRSGYRMELRYGALEKISDLVYQKGTRFRKNECLDIPAKSYDHRIITLTPYMREKYNEMVRWAITQIEAQQETSGAVKAPIVLTQLLRLSQITSGFVVDETGKIVDFEDQPKIEALKELIEEMDLETQKFIVWARFQHDVEKIFRLIYSMDIGVVELYGNTRPEIRVKNIKAFQTDPTVKALVGTAATGGFGIDLVEATTIVYYSNSYSLEQRLQSEDRSHRAGQNKKVTYIDLLAEKTIDVSIYKILRAKKKIADVVTKDNIYSITAGEKNGLF